MQGHHYNSSVFLVSIILKIKPKFSFEDPEPPKKIYSANFGWKHLFLNLTLGKTSVFMAFQVVVVLNHDKYGHRHCNLMEMSVCFGDLVFVGFFCFLLLLTYCPLLASIEYLLYL